MEVKIDRITKFVKDMTVEDQESMSCEEKWLHSHSKMSSDIKFAEDLVYAPEHMKDRSYYFYHVIQVSMLKENLRILYQNAHANVYGDYCRTPQFLQLASATKFWYRRLREQIIKLKRKINLSIEQDEKVYSKLKFKIKSDRIITKPVPSQMIKQSYTKIPI